MPTNGDTLSLVLLIVAIGSTGLAACGSLVLGGMALSRRWHDRSSRQWRESPTVVFRALQADPDPTDRFTDYPLFGASDPADEDPFGGDTVPFVDLELIGRTDAVADL